MVLPLKFPKLLDILTTKSNIIISIFKRRI